MLAPQKYVELQQPQSLSSCCPSPTDSSALKLTIPYSWTDSLHPILPYTTELINVLLYADTCSMHLLLMQQ